MRSLLVYSGKGGVGKTTITYGLFKALKKMGVKVAVLDMDLNTPSFHLLESGEDVISSSKNYGLFVEPAQANQFITEAKLKIEKLNPEVLLIDSPPSITHIHYAIMQKLDVSGVILVTQPTKMSVADVERTIPYFEQKQITVTGIVENMAGDEDIEYNYPLIASIKNGYTLDSEVVYKQNREVFKNLAQTLADMDLKETSLDNKKRQMFDSSITFDMVCGMYDIEENSYGDLYIYQNSPYTDINKVKFVNLATWGKLRDVLMELDFSVQHGLKDVLSEATPEKVGRILKAVEDDGSALFMIIRNVQVSGVIIGEVGTGTLVVQDRHHGIPLVEYKTKNGSVILYPHEVIPANQDIINDCLADGYEYIESGSRLIPSLECAQTLSSMFGERSETPSKAISDKWHKIMNKSQPA